MRPLIAITCVAIIAAIGYFGWGEFSRMRAAQELADFQKERAGCLYSLKQNIEPFIKDCIASGHLRQSEVNG